MANELYPATTFVENEIPSHTKLNAFSTRVGNSMQLVANALIGGIGGQPGTFSGQDNDALKVVASSTPDMNVTVNAGVASISDTIAQCETAKVMTIVAPAVSNRYTIIEIDSDGDIGTVNGTEAASPVEPDTTAGAVKLAALYLTLNCTQIKNADDGSEGYIIDRREILPGHYHDVRAYDASANGDTTTTGSITTGTSALTLTSGNTFLEDQGIVVDGALIDADDTANTPDTDQDFTTTGADEDIEWIGRAFQAVNTGRVCTVALTLGKTGSPAGTLNAYIYTNSGGLPVTQVNGASVAITNTDLNAAAGGATQEFTWTSNFPLITAGTNYWVVLKTTGYTYVDGVTEIRWRTDADGGSSECVKYDANAGTPWTTMGATVGADVTVSVELLTNIVSIAGTAVVTEDVATHTATSMTIHHEESVATQAALDRINAAGGGLLFFPSGTYRYESAVSIYSNTTLQGAGESSIISIPFGEELWAGKGTLSGTTYSLTSDGDALQFDVALGGGDGSNFSADDWFRLSSDEKFDGDADVVERELRKIYSISTDTLTCDTVLAHTYTTANNAEIAKVTTMLENITMTGLRFAGGGSSYEQQGVEFEYCDNLRIQNCSFIDFYQHALSIASCVNFSLDGLYVDNCQLSGFGYGVVVTGSSRDYTIIKSHFKRCRHGIAHGGTDGVQRHGVINGNLFQGGVVAGAAIDQHHSVEWLEVGYNICHGQSLASPSGIHLSFHHNIIRSAGAGAGIKLWTDAHDIEICHNVFHVSEYGVSAETAFVSNIIIHANKFLVADESEATVYGTWLGVECDDVQVNGNTFDGMDYGVFIRSTLMGGDSHDITINGNTYRNISGTPIDIMADTGGDLYHIQILNNMLEVGGGQRGIYVFDDGVQKVSGLLIDNNYIHGGHTGIEVAGSNTENWRIGSGNVINGASATPVEVGANVNGGVVGTMARSASLDLSGAAVDNEVFIAPDNCCLVMYDIVYTEASSADAGVNIRIGRYQDGVALDDDYFDMTTSEVNQNLGAKTRIATASLTQYQLTAGDIVTVGTAGGKVGTGEVMLVLYFCLSAQ